MKCWNATDRSARISDRLVRARRRGLSRNAVERQGTAPSKAHVARWRRSRSVSFRCSFFMADAACGRVDGMRPVSDETRGGQHHRQKHQHDVDEGESR